jgi:hypothetical protein
MQTKMEKIDPLREDDSPDIDFSDEAQGEK